MNGMKEDIVCYGECYGFVGEDCVWDGFVGVLCVVVWICLK